MVEYVKACDCEGTSSTGQIRVRADKSVPGWTRYVMTHYQGPSCDACGEPWVRKEKEEE